MRVKVYGARGSCPVAVSPERVDEIARAVWEFSRGKSFARWEELRTALRSEKPRSHYQVFGGHTTCLEIRDERLPMPVFVDAGTGLTAAATDPDSGLNSVAFKENRGEAAFFFTHTHWDHIIGLPTVEQIFKPGNRFDVYGVHKKLEERLAALFVDEHFPVSFETVSPQFRFHQIPLHESVQLGPFRIDHVPQSHPGASFAYRFSDGKKTFVFATDTELKNIDPPHMTPGQNVYSNADVLMLDAQYSPEDLESRRGYGHASVHTAVDFAVREKSKVLYLFHQNPAYSDAEIDEQLNRARHYLKSTHAASKLRIEMTFEGAEIEL